MFHADDTDIGTFNKNMLLTKQRDLQSSFQSCSDNLKIIKFAKTELIISKRRMNSSYCKLRKSLDIQVISDCKITASYFILRILLF